jgi:mono/diheme cytochrome c family protein
MWIGTQDRAVFVDVVTSDVPDGATEMTLPNRGEPADFATVTGPMMARAMARANRADLARLKAILETD